MRKIDKFLKIKKEVDDKWSDLTWTRKRQLLKEVYEIKVFNPLLYIFLLIISFATYLSITIGFILKKPFFVNLLNGSGLFLIFVSIISVIIIVYSFISLFEALKFKNKDRIDYKTCKLKLFNDIKKSEERFYKVVNANLDDLSDHISQNLVKDYCLAEDMVETFKQDIKISMNHFRFRPVYEDSSYDELHSQTRHENL